MTARRLLLLLPLLAACASGDEPRSYPLPSYSHLTPLRLNVASIEVDDRSAPVSGDQVAALSPLRPADALKQMAQDRLTVGGSGGRAVFVIDQADVRRGGAGLDGRMAVHLDIYAGGEQRVGFAEAQVVRRRVSTDMGEDPRAVLYDFVAQMMDDMNVEFEFQVRRSLKEYLQDTAGAAPLPPPVQAEDLAAPVRATPVPAPPLGNVLRQPGR